MGSLQTKPWVQRVIAAGLPVKVSHPSELGRWSMNLILQGEDVVVDLDEQSGVTTLNGSEPLSGEVNRYGIYGTWSRERTGIGVGKVDTGGASRFFKQVQNKCE